MGLTEAVRGQADGSLRGEQARWRDQVVSRPKGGERMQSTLADGGFQVQGRY